MTHSRARKITVATIAGAAVGLVALAGFSEGVLKKLDVRWDQRLMVYNTATTLKRDVQELQSEVSAVKSTLSGFITDTTLYRWEQRLREIDTLLFELHRLNENGQTRSVDQVRMQELERERNGIIRRLNNRE